MKNFALRLQYVNQRVPIPKVVITIIWDQVVRLINRTMLEGFSNARKCTNEGRALMQLDYQQFLIQLEKLTDLRPIPDKELVESYVKAYYLPEAQLEEWIKDHKVTYFQIKEYTSIIKKIIYQDYSIKQMVNLLIQIPHLNKKMRQKLITNVEESNRKP